VKTQRQLEIFSNNVAVPVNDRSAPLALVGLGNGGALKVGLKGDTLLDTKSMFEGLLPTQGESRQYQDAEKEYMRALGRSLEHNPMAGLGLSQIEEKKPERGVVTAPISDKVSLSDKNPSLAQAGYVPAPPEQHEPLGRRRWSRSKSRGKTRHKSRSRSRKKHHKHNRDRSSSRKRRKRSRDRRRSASKRRKSRSASKGRKKKSRSASRGQAETAPIMDYLSLKTAGAEVPKKLLEQQESKAMAIRAKLTKAKPDSDTGNDSKGSGDLRASVLAERRRDLSAVAAADEDFNVENRVKNVLKKKLEKNPNVEEGIYTFRDIISNIPERTARISRVCLFFSKKEKRNASLFRSKWLAIRACEHGP